MDINEIPAFHDISKVSITLQNSKLKEPSKSVCNSADAQKVQRMIREECLQERDARGIPNILGLPRLWLT
jgi:hypothetical protein